jgi:hypothetical protein
MLQAVEAQSLPIISLEKASTGTGVAILTIMITDVIGFMNIGKTMTPLQVRATVDLILSDFNAKNLKPEDFKVMFDNAKKGLYGKAYDRLDGQVIFEWINAYMNERMTLCEQLNLNIHGKVKKADNLVHPEVIEMYKKMLPEIKKIEETRTVEKKVVQKSERDILIQKLFLEFYEIWKKNPFTPPIPEKMDGMILGEAPGKFIKVDGKVMDEVEYVEFKLKNHVGL